MRTVKKNEKKSDEGKKKNLFSGNPAREKHELPKQHCRVCIHSIYSMCIYSVQYVARREGRE